MLGASSTPIATRLRSLPGCRAATSPCGSRTSRRVARCAPASPGSATSWSCPRTSRPTCWPRPRRRPRRPTCRRTTSTDLPLPHHRPARLDGPGPGDAPRAARDAASGCATRSPTSAAFVAPGRRDRRRGAPAGRDALQPGHPHPAAPAGAVGGRGVAAARPGPRRPCSGRSTSTRTASRPRSTYGGRMVRSTRPARLRGRAGPRRRRHGRRAARSCSPRSASCGWPLEVERGGVSLPIPEQEVVEDGGTLPAGVPGDRCRSSRGTSRSR